ncbi:MoxR family ATPase [Streptomyces sp. ISL-99]|uniref:AAA family ATPase n=1 Tax=Streptomyces sp. ISL-99 TaxID=2819193 RepID=UPI001BE5AD48|nr:MoxR family ATPase [Streptomyces sp. ISL-99]MBT2530421.1 MoxR family ATPase [Streptomyces sp. ISL-99]
MTLWPVYTGSNEPHDGVDALPDPPPWRTFDGGPALPAVPEEEREGGAPGRVHRARTYQPTPETVQLVNAALYLRRPLLVTGPPGSGKSSLPYAVARELKLGRVLRWNITSRTTLTDGLYRYDPLSRLYAAGRVGTGEPDAEETAIEDHLRLGSLGTALLPRQRPRVLLIDEIDKSDLDLPNDLLHILEEGQYEIPELVRAARSRPVADVMVADSEKRVPLRHGEVRCRAFPFVVLTSNGEREFPPAFLRRCVRLELRRPLREQLEDIVRAHLGDLNDRDLTLVDTFLRRGSAGELATDQLLNAIYLTRTSGLAAPAREDLAEKLMPYLGRAAETWDTDDV